MSVSVVCGERGVSRYNQIKKNLRTSASQQKSCHTGTLSENEIDLSYHDDTFFPKVTNIEVL